MRETSSGIKIDPREIKKGSEEEVRYFHQKCQHLRDL